MFERGLALCDVGGDPLVVAGAWERHGICAYTPDGARVWQRKDLRQPVHLSPAGGGALVAACFDDRPMHVLTAESGETVTKVRAVRKFFASPFAPAGLGATEAHVVLVDASGWTIRWRSPVEGFAVLAAAASPDACTVADVVDHHDRGRSSVTCLSAAGDVVWRWPVPREANCPALAWHARAGEWVGVLRHVSRRRPPTLVRWSADGEVVDECPLGIQAPSRFLPSGRWLVTGDGEVRDTLDGSVAWQFPAA